MFRNNRGLGILAALIAVLWVGANSSAQVLEFDQRKATTLKIPPQPVLERLTSEIHGFMHANVGGKERGIPEVTVYSRDLSGNESLRTRTDCRGRFVIKPMPLETYEICWEAEGYVNDCGSIPVVLGPETAFPQPYVMQVELSAMSGSVALFDGSPASFTDSGLGVSHQPRVTLIEAATGTALRSVPTGCDGGFAIAGIGAGLYELEAEYAGETVVVPATPGGQDYDLRLPNNPPSVRLAYISSAGTPVRRAAAGQTVSVHVVTDDADADSMTYFFEPSDGTLTEDPVDGTVWTLGQNTSHTLSIVATDDRGGYDRYQLIVENSVEVPFSGRVLDPSGDPLVAEVEINGISTFTDSSGRFDMLLGQATDRYVVTIRSQGYRLFSRIYPDSVVGNTFTLQPAQIVPINPQQMVRILPAQTDGAGLEIPAGGLVDGQGQPATGPLNVYISTIEPTNPDGNMPGDQLAMNSLGETVPLVSYGAISISVEDAAGNEFNLQPGTWATVTIPVPEMKMNGDEPQVLPLWIYEETLGVWEEVGQAQLQGDRYVGQIPHFSEINADIELTNAVCLQLNVDEAYAPFYKPDPLSFPLDVRIEIPSTGDILIKEIDQAVNSIYGLPPLTAMDLVIVDSNGDPIEATRKSISTGPYDAGCPFDPPYPYTCCTASTTLKPDIPTGVDFLAYIEISSDEEAWWYASVTDPVITPATGLISVSGLTVTGTGTSFTTQFVEGDLIRATPTSGIGTVESVGNEVTGTGTFFTTQFVVGDIIEIGGKTQMVENIISDSKLETLGPFTPDFAPGSTFKHIEVRMIDSIATNTLMGIDGAFHHEPAGATFEKVGLRPNLTAWETVNNFNPPDHEAAYYNGADLGFGRWMKNRVNGTGTFYSVANFVDFPGVFHPDKVDDAVANASGATSPPARFATVLMEYSDPYYGGTPYTKFFVYNSVGRRALNANLDGLGTKPLPRLCLMCHGGEPDSTDHRGDMEATFLPFDLETFHYSSNPSYTRSAQESELKELNRDILGTSPTAATADMINGSYAPAMTSPAFIDGWVPSGWSGNAGLYNDVVQKTCRGCHLTQASYMSWDDYSNFNSLSGVIQGKICDDKAMPAARLTFTNFWLSSSPNQANALESAGLSSWNTASPCE